MGLNRVTLLMRRIFCCLSCLLFFVLVTNFAAVGASSHERNRLPLAFEPTASDPLTFVARGDGYAMRVSDASVTLWLGPEETGIGWRLEGTAEGILPVAQDQLQGHVNYLIGANPAQWRVNVPTYGSIVFRSIYPGIDAVFYGNQRELEHDYVLAPHANVNRIRLLMIGSQSVLSRGEVLIRDEAHSIRLYRPSAYQLDARGVRHEVATAYVRHRDGSFGFKVGKYDHSRALTIDPVLSYSTYLAGSDGENGEAIAVDSSGSAYVTGLTFSTDFPTTTGVVQSTCKSCASSNRRPDVFVSKLNATGTALVYSTYVGGSDYDQPSSIAVDSGGDAVVGGHTVSQDFPVANNNDTWGVYPGPIGGLHTHGFLFSLNATGSGFNFSKYIAGTGDDSVAGVSVDSSGNIFAVGSTYSPNFPVTPGTLPETAPAYPLNDIFIMKFVPAGTLTFSALLEPTKQSTSPWANYLYPSGIAADSNDDIFITGWASSGFPTTTGAYQPAFNGNPNAQTYNAFVAKLDSAGSQILAATYLGGSSQDETKAIALDSSGNVYITGTTDSANFPTTASAYEATFPASAGSTPCCGSFAAKFDPTLATLGYSTLLTGASGSGYVNSFAIAVDSAGQAIVTGATTTSDFPLVAPVVAEPAVGQFGSSTTAFVTQFNSAGSGLVFSSYYGGSTGSQGAGVALDGSGSAYITGTTNDTDLPTTPGAYQTSVTPPAQFSTPSHVYVAKIDIPAPGPALCTPNMLRFPDVLVGTPSQKSVTITNCGNAPLTVSSVTAGGDFTQTNNCTAAISPTNSCTVQVTFTPTVEAQRTATLLITSNTGVITRVALSGYGAEAHVGALPTPIPFDSMLIGVTTPVGRLIFVTNVGSYPLTISDIATAGDFAQTNDCTQTLYPSQSCAVRLTFTPTAAGVRSGTLTVTSNDPKGPATATLNGTGYAAYPAPTINSVSPNSAAVNASNVQLTVIGSNFFPASVIQINGADHTTLFTSGSSVSTTLTAADLATMSEPQVTVSTPGPGGGTTSAQTLTVYLSLPITAAGLTFDPYSRRLFAAVPSGAANYANSVVPIDPFSGTVGTAVQVGNDPAKTVVSNDGRYLYIALNGDHAVRRYDIAQASPDIEINMPSDPNFGQLRAIELAVVPNDSHSFLATLQRSNVSPSEGGMALFTDGTTRTFLSNNFPAYVAPDTVRFLSDPTVAWGLGYGYGLVKFSLSSSGLSVVPNQGSGLISGQIESDGTYLYSTFGQVYDPVHQTLVGKYANFTTADTVAPDTPLGRTFFYDNYQLYAYDQSSFAQLGTISVGQNVGNSILTRWGSDGFALAMVNAFDHGKDSVAIFRSHFARPNADTTLTPTLATTTPATQSEGSGNFQMTLTGTNFVAGAVVLWNSTELTTKFVNSTTLLAYVSNSDIAQPGNISVTVKNPNGTISGAATFTITGNVSLSASSVSLGSQLLGANSAGQSITLTNSGATPLTITGVTASSGFSQTNNCSSVAAAASCNITVTFQPAAAGAATGVLTITASDGESLNVPLSGNATDFAIATASGSSTSASVVPGQPATFNLAVSPLSGFTGNVALSCTGAPTLSQCTISPGSVTVGSGSAAFTVTLTTTAAIAGLQTPYAPPAPPNGGAALWAMAAAILGFVVIRRPRLTPIFAMLVLGVALTPGCGGGGGGTKPPVQNPQPGTPAGSYALTITATSQSVSRQMTLNVTVQ